MEEQTQKLTIRQLLMYLSVAVATLLMFLYHYTDAAIFAWAGLCFMLLPILFINSNECVYLLLFYVPNIAMYKLTKGNTFVGFVVVAIFAKMVFMQSPFFSRGIAVSLLSMMTVLLINAMVAENTALFSPFFRFSMGMVIMLNYARSIQKSENYQEEYRKCFYHFLYGTASLLACGLLYYFLKGMPLFDTRFRAVNSDPNFFSMIMGVAISLLLTHIAFDKKAGTKEFVVLLFLLFGGVLTVSRGFLVSVSVNLFLVLSIFIKNKNVTFQQKAIFFFLILIVCFVFRDAIKTIIDSYIDRFNADDVEGGNGRVEIEANFYWLWRENIFTILFGVGRAFHLVQIGLASNVHHNYYIELLTSIGIFGVLSMLNIYRVMFRGVVPKEVKFRLYLKFCFPILTYAIMLLTLPAMFDDTHLIMMVMILLQYRTFLDKERSALSHEALLD